MKIVIRFCLTIIALTTLASGQLTDGDYWYAGTARLLPEGRKVCGLFQPLRYGRSETVEWSLNPALALLIPNGAVKVAAGEMAGWERSWRVSAHYPTLLLRTLTKESTAGVLAPDPTIPEVPHILFARGEMLLTRELTGALTLTVKGGLALALKAGDLDSRNTIHLPIVYPRMAAYEQGYQLNLGADLLATAPLSKRLWVDADLFITPGYDFPLVFEHKGVVVLSRQGRLGVLLGYKLTWAEYPFGSQWHLLPLVDITWTRNKKTKD